MSLVVFYDVFELAPGIGKSIGIYNYAKNLFASLVKNSDEEIEWHVACNGACVEDFKVDSKKVFFHIYNNKSPGKFKRQLWIGFGAALAMRKLKADIYFSPKGFLARSLNFICPNALSLVTIHDLIPFWYKDNYPSYFGYFEELVVLSTLKNTAINANHIIAISESTANDLQIRLGRHNNLHIIYNGLIGFKPIEINFKKPFIFSVASKLPHKNVIGILNAYKCYRDLVEDPLPLVLCGYEVLNSPGVISVSGITDSEMHWYYANAEVFLFLSLIEGFGFPPVEAMLNGTPVICSNIPSLMEVTAGSAYYVDPENSYDIAVKISEVLSFQKNKVKLFNIAARYNWDECAKKTVNVILSMKTNN